MFRRVAGRDVCELHRPCVAIRHSRRPVLVGRAREISLLRLYIVKDNTVLSMLQHRISSICTVQTSDTMRAADVLHCSALIIHYPNGIMAVRIVRHKRSQKGLGLAR